MPLVLKSTALASRARKATVSHAALRPLPSRRAPANSSVAAPASAPAPINRKSQSAAWSDAPPVSPLARAGSNTPSGEVKLCTRSPGVNTRPWPCTRFLLLRKVM